MSWIESHQNLRDHRKTFRLARELTVPRVQVIGQLHCLWWWAVENAPNGFIADEDLDGAAEASFSSREGVTFGAALVAAGFAERAGSGIHLHDWDDYAGRLMAQRAANTARMRAARAQRAKTTLLPSTPEPSFALPAAEDARESALPTPSLLPALPILVPPGPALSRPPGSLGTPPNVAGGTVTRPVPVAGQAEPARRATEEPSVPGAFAVPARPFAGAFDRPAGGTVRATEEPSMPDAAAFALPPERLTEGSAGFRPLAAEGQLARAAGVPSGRSGFAAAEPAAPGGIWDAPSACAARAPHVQGPPDLTGPNQTKPNQRRPGADHVGAASPLAPAPHRPFVAGEHDPSLPPRALGSGFPPRAGDPPDEAADPAASGVACDAFGGVALSIPDLLKAAQEALGRPQANRIAIVGRVFRTVFGCPPPDWARFGHIVNQSGAPFELCRLIIRLSAIWNGTDDPLNLLQGALRRSRQQEEARPSGRMVDQIRGGVNYVELARERGLIK